MLRVYVTEDIKERICDILSSGAVTDERRVASLEELQRKETLTITDVKMLVNANKEAGLSPIKDVLSSSKLDVSYFQNKGEKVSEEVIKRREYLKLKAEESSYNMMMFGKTENPHTKEVITMGNQHNEMRSQAVTGFSMIFTIIATFGMAYYLSQKMGFHEPQAMMIGLVAAILIMILEMTLFIMRAVQLEDALESKPTQLKETEAKLKSGALVTPNDVQGSVSNSIK